MATGRIKLYELTVPELGTVNVFIPDWDRRRVKHVLQVIALDNGRSFKIVYHGSIRKLPSQSLDEATRDGIIEKTWFEIGKLPTNGSGFAAIRDALNKAAVDYRISEIFDITYPEFMLKTTARAINNARLLMVSRLKEAGEYYEI